MNGKAVAWLACLGWVLCLSGATFADDSAPALRTAMTPDIKADPKGAPNARSSTEDFAAAASARKTCINQCNIANGHCNSVVRQARQECSRKAATGGRDPMTKRTSDYTYFCDYFRDSGRRRGSFSARFTEHYNVCVDVMNQNVASMRYDCHRNERDAQNICRNELRECQAECS